MGRGRTGGRKKPRLTKHRAITDKKFGRTQRIPQKSLCPICQSSKHTRNEHRFHGKGSFKRTHKISSVK